MNARSLIRLATTALLVGLLAGCSVLTGGARNPFAGGPQGERTISLDVRNLNFADATIHVFRGGERIRAGIVVGKGSQTFRIPWTLSRTLQLEIDLIGGGRCLTRELQASPGDRIEVQVPVDIATDPDCRGR